MTDQELLLAISDIVEKKIKAAVEPVKIDMKYMETGIRQDMKNMEIGIRQDMKDMEDGIRQDIKDMEDGIRQDMKDMEARMSKAEIHLEVIDSKIDLLVENYLPAAKRFEKASEQIESLQADTEVMKSVIRKHSEKLQMIS